MRILVMGAGGIGTFFGVQLSRAGHEVEFVARGAHLEAMQRRGIEVHDGDEVCRIHPVRAFSSPAEACGPFDLALFTVKCYDTEPAARALLPALVPETAVLPLQNGVDSVDRLSRILGSERVLAGAAFVTVHIAEPGVIVKLSPSAMVTLGETTGEVSSRVEAVARAFEGAGIVATISRDPVLAIWDKFVGLAPFATLTAACQSTIGEIRQSPEAIALGHQLISEVAAVARAAGVNLSQGRQNELAAFFFENAPSTLKASMAVDYERQHKVELEDLAGAVVRKGIGLGVPTPGFSVLYAILKARALAFGGLPGQCPLHLTATRSAC